MAQCQSQFSLSWDDHSKNICNGLSFLQQNGEFVDMTLAADGHFVKVHQVIMALSSPFFKDLISAAQCPHPVIVLNKISHATLEAILEYIYTGEVLVAIEDLNELIDTAKELHIKGLREMNLSQALTVNRQRSNEMLSQEIDTLDNDEDICYFEISKESDELNGHDLEKDSLIVTDIRNITHGALYQMSAPERSVATPTAIIDIRTTTLAPPRIEEKVGTLQYTVSNQGSLQMILNRYIYYLKHTNRDNSRQWRCVDYLNSCKCPALVVTKDDVVVQRISAHKHPYHDKKIMKKVTSHTVFTAVRDAETEGTNIKNKPEENESE